MIRVAIVDDQPIVRASLRDFLHSQPGIEVVAEGANGSQAVALVKRCQIDVLLMDLCMPGRNGLDALAAVRAAAPQVGVLILSGYPEELYALDLLRQGAAGFLHKNCQPDEIVTAIRAVAEGRFYKKGRPHARHELPRSVPHPGVA